MVTTETLVQKSRFIGFLIRVESENSAKSELERLRNLHPNASHHTFAYIIGDNGEIQKASDDKEPSKTAGVPILEILKKHELTDVIAVVIRYFGGIKLGAGGLIRAYADQAKRLVDLSVMTTKKQIDTYEVRVDYPASKNVERILHEHALTIEADYLETILYRFTLLHEKAQIVSEAIDHATHFQNKIQLLQSKKTY